MGKQIEPFPVFVDFGVPVDPNAPAAPHIYEQHSNMRIFQDVPQAAKTSITHVMRENEFARIEYFNCRDVFSLAAIATVALSAAITRRDKKEIQRLYLLEEVIREARGYGDIRGAELSPEHLIARKPDLMFVRGAHLLFDLLALPFPASLPALFYKSFYA